MPHNLGEVCDLVAAFIDKPDMPVEEMMKILPAPDFPTGGIIMGIDGVRNAYLTGQGKVVVRGVAEVEERKKNYEQIVITEIPYQVNKAVMIEKIADLVKSKQIEGISDLRDESDKDGIRVIIELKQGVQGNVILNQLYKHTQLQETFGAIMLCIVKGEPKVLNLKQMLDEYLEHQENIFTRRTQFNLKKAQDRAHILEGFLKALDYIDEIVKIIRNSADTEDAKAKLMERFDLSNVQAQAIVDMRLRALTGLEREKLENEHKELLEKIAYLKSILADEKLLLGVIKDEILLIFCK